MAKGAKKVLRREGRHPNVSAEVLADLVTRLRTLPATAGPDEIQATVGEAAEAVPAAAHELGRSGDDSALAGLAALLTVPAFALPAVEALGTVRDAAAVQLLQQAAAAPSSREVAKAARRGLHALAGAGLTVELPAPSADTAVFRPLPAEGVAWSGALAGPIAADGTRSLLLGQKRLPTGAATAIGVTSELAGLVYFQAVPQTHRQLDKEWQVFLDERPETLAQEIPFPYAQWLLAGAAESLSQMGRELPEEYTAWLKFTGNQPTDVSPDLVYAEAGVDPASPPTITASRAIALLAEPEIEPWTLPFDATSPFGAELLSTRTSPLILSESAQADRERQLVSRAAGELFDAELRQRYKRRLEETALLFQRSGRSDQARAALATAIAFGDATVPPSDIPFALALTLRAVETAAEVAAPTSREGEAARARLFGV